LRYKGVAALPLPRGQGAGVRATRRQVGASGFAVGRRAAAGRRTGVAAPDPHAPVVGGADIFRAATERALRGVRVHWVEDIGWAHSGGGEVHCTTNAWRAVS
jgi:hypothetical protein